MKGRNQTNGSLIATLNHHSIKYKLDVQVHIPKAKLPPCKLEWL